MHVPYFRLSAFYLFYFASLGAFVPYWSVYLQSLSFTPGQIGELMAISLTAKVFAPYLWGWLADHTGKRIGVIRLTSFGAALVFSATIYHQSYWTLALVLAGYSFFWHAALPQFEAITMNYLGAQRTRYSLIRLWGSIGFILSVVMLGWWFDRAAIANLPTILLFLLSSIWVVTLLLKNAANSQSVLDHAPMGEILRRPEVIALFVASFLLQASHGPYYAFFSIYLESYGYSRANVGLFWALGVLAEVGVFLLVHRWLNQVGAVRLFRIAVLLTSIRWVMIALGADVLPVLLLAQLLHAASYGLFHASAIELFNHFFPGKIQGRGQALYSSISFGLGNALGSLASGYLWTSAGAENTYLLAAVVCFLGVLVAGFIHVKTALHPSPGR